MLSACLDQTTFVQPPPPGSSGDTTSGAVQRAALVVTVAVASTDTVLASRIGSPGGLLAQAAVTIEREGSAASRQSDTTGSPGTVMFAGLLPGRYRVTVLRVLTAAEIVAFDSADADVSAFGGGATLEVNAPQTAVTVQAFAGRRGSLVISELDYAAPSVNDWVYNFAGFLELYNNSDTTIYLDGKLVGRGPNLMHDCRNCFSYQFTCEETAPYQLDPDGLWSSYIWRFPGSGRDHPLGPGKAVVLATDAIDHRPVDPRLPDLSRADFEFIGATDADNPAVPNMVREGLEFFWPLGHGLLFGMQGIYYIAEGSDLALWPSVNLPPNAQQAWRVPRSTVLDVLAASMTPEQAASVNEPPLCPQWINPLYDRQPGAFFEELTTNSARRRVFMTLPNGRVILLRTKSTANDFEVVSAGTPGVVP